MAKKYGLVLLLAVIAQGTLAQVTQVTSNCQLYWSPPIAGGPVAGYTVYLERQQPYELANYDAGLNLVFDCVNASLASGTEYLAWVTAYNAIGESAPSGTVLFEIIELKPGWPEQTGIREKPSQ